MTLRHLLVLALVAALGCGRPIEGTAERDASAPSPAVTVARPERRAMARTIMLAASLEAYEQAPLYAKVPGYVERITVDIGDRVEAGQIVATLEVPEMAQRSAEAESQLAERRAELAKAEAETALQKAVFARSQGLRAKDAITEQDLEQARAGSASAIAGLELARARMRSAEARLAERRALMDYARLRAPFTGIVTRRLVDRGALVQAATSSSGVSPVVVVARIDRVRVLVDVPEPDVPSIDRGDRAVLEIAALPGRLFPGEITRFAGALDPASRTMRTEVDFSNPDGALRPGMYGALAIDVEAHPAALTVPEGAVRREKRRAVVYVLDGERAVERAVTTGLSADERIEVVEGLGEDEPVIVSGGANLTDGARVRVVQAVEGAS